MATQILVLTEDTGREAVPTFRALLKRLVHFYDDMGQLTVTVRPGQEREYPRVGSNFWRENGERAANDRRLLCKTIATNLALGEVVLFHTDADATWATQHERLSQDFDAKIRRPVRQWLNDAGARNGRDPAWAQACEKRLIHVVPTWSIEAWTYQATGKALELCGTQYGGRDAAKFRIWEGDRAQLDEVAKPKDHVCLSNKHNAKLAAAVPVAEVFALGKSFTRFVQTLRELSEFSDRMHC